MVEIITRDRGGNNGSQRSSVGLSGLRLHPTIRDTKTWQRGSRVSDSGLSVARGGQSRQTLPLSGVSFESFASCFLFSDRSASAITIVPSSRALVCCVQRAVLLNIHPRSCVPCDFVSVISRIFPRVVETRFYCEEVRSHFRALNLEFSIALPHACVFV